MPEQIKITGKVTGTTMAPETKHIISGSWMPATTFDSTTGAFTCVLTGVPGGNYPQTTFNFQIPGTNPLVTLAYVKPAFTVPSVPAPTPTPSGDNSYTYTDFEPGATTLDQYEFMTI